MLEETVKKQAQQIVQLKKQTMGTTDHVDPILTHVQQYTMKENNASVYFYIYYTV